MPTFAYECTHYVCHFILLIIFYFSAFIKERYILKFKFLLHVTFLEHLVPLSSSSGTSIFMKDYGTFNVSISQLTFKAMSVPQCACNAVKWGYIVL